MKRHRQMFQKIWGVIFFLAFSPAAWAYNYDFYTGGIYYNITSYKDKTVEVTSKTGYSSDYSGKVTIPETVSYNGTVYSVTAIGDNAFSWCGGLTSVTIPESVQTIGVEAFYRCNGLTSITIPDGVTSIGEQAFSGCTRLKSVTIPESVTTIFRDAFLDCTGLNAVRISDMAAWCKISFHKYDTIYVSYGNLHQDVSWATNPLEYAHNLYLDDNLVTDLKIPENITSIGAGAFYGCTSLTSVTIPKGVVSVGEAAFSGCTGLKEVHISDVEAWCKISFSSSVTYDYDIYSDRSWESNPLTYAHNLYLDGKLATDLKIPENVTTIHSGAFSGCSGLKSITIPKSVTSISSDAFLGCTGLNAVHISDLAAWCKITFYPTSASPYRVASNPLYYAHNLYLNDNLVTDLKIPKEVTVIPDAAFYGCTSLTSVTIPNSVTTIGIRAFDDCTGLKAVYISDLAAWCKISFYSNPLGCAHNLYLDGKLVTDLKIPENITIINSAFAGCSMTSVTIPESVISIGAGAFVGCTGLTSVTIPESVTTIGASAFQNCASLMSVTIPESVISIGAEAFKSCSGLKEVWYNANSCTIWYSNVFMGCTSLKTVHIGKNVKYISDNTFYGCTSLEKFEGKWASKDHRCLVVNDTLKMVAPSGLTEYTIPDGVTTIGSSAFYDCDSLTSVTIPENVTTICSSAFSGCTNLQTITPLGTTPPTCFGYPFDNATYQKATVNYPKGSLHAYKTAPYWSNFTYNYPLPEKALNPQLTGGSVGETKYHCTVIYTHDIEYPVSKFYMAANEKEYPLDADTTLAVIPVTVTDLEPETEYDAQFIIETIYGDQVVMPVTFTTDTVHLTARPAKTTDVKATLEAAVECDAETGYGFEWRRYGAPDNLPPTRVEAYNIDGKIAGTLRNLTPEAYYEFRPYYHTVSGKYYYDEWVAFGTFDYGVEWDPTVSTRAGEVEGNNSTISAYVVEGSDELLSQGFEYWAETPAARSTESIATRSTASEPERIEGSGTLMSVTLTGLDYNTTYYYRAYATTAKKTTYGNTESFTTGKKPVEKDFKPSGINPTDNSEVEALKTFTLEFVETPNLAAEAQPITLAGKDTLLTATLTAGEGNTLEITLADTLKVAGEYTLTIPEGTFGDADFADDPTVGHCNPALTYTYTIKVPVEQDFKPTGITPDNGAEVTELKTFTLEFTEMLSLAAEAQPITLAGKDTLLTATLAAGEGNTLEITLADTLKVAGEYTLTIPEGAFGNADFAADPTVGRCNPALTYTYTIKEPEPVEPDEPDEPSSITETTTDADGHITVYNLQGMPVLETNDAADLKTLQNGAYIVNGKTMIIAR